MNHMKTNPFLVPIKLIETEEVTIEDKDTKFSFTFRFKDLGVSEVAEGMSLSKKYTSKYVPLEHRTDPNLTDEPIPFPPIGGVSVVVTENTVQSACYLYCLQWKGNGMDDVYTVEEIIAIFYGHPDAASQLGSYMEKKFGAVKKDLAEE